MSNSIARIIMSLLNIIHTLSRFPTVYVQSFKFHLSIAMCNHRINKYNKVAIKRGLPLLPKYIIQ